MPNTNQKITAIQKLLRDRKSSLLIQIILSTPKKEFFSENRHGGTLRNDHNNQLNNVLILKTRKLFAKGNFW
jgi:hypothetical protein